jgi:hypothetical protein
MDSGKLALNLLHLVLPRSMRFACFPQFYMVYYLLVAINHPLSNFIVVFALYLIKCSLLGSGSCIQPETPALVAGDSGLDAKSPVLAGDSGPSPRRLRLDQA